MDKIVENEIGNGGEEGDEVDFLDYWKLVPILGEISKKKAVIIFVLKDVNNTVECQIKLFHIVLQTYIIQPTEGVVTRVVIDLPRNELIKLEWYQNLHLIYEHWINAKIQPDRLIFTSIDYQSNKQTRLWDRIIAYTDNPQLRYDIVHLGGQVSMAGLYHQIKNQNKYRDKHQQLDRMIAQTNHMYFRMFNLRKQILSCVVNHWLIGKLELGEEDIIDENHWRARQFCINSYLTFQESQNLDIVIGPGRGWCKLLGSETLMLAIDTLTVDYNLDFIRERVKIEDVPNIKRLVVVSATPPIPQPETADQWPRQRLQELFTWLFDWKKQIGNREVVVFGGGSYYGVYARVYSDRDHIPAVIGSPMTDGGNFQHSVACANMEDRRINLGPLVYHIVEASPTNCYATLDLSTEPMTCSLLVDKTTKMVKLGKYYHRMLKRVGLG